MTERMTNLEWLRTLDADGFTRLLAHKGSTFACSPCNICAYEQESFDCRTRKCLDGIREWLEAEHEERGGDGEDSSPVYSPSHYTSGGVETIVKIEQVVAGLPADSAYLLGNVVKYVDRAGKKGDADEDLAKARNYAHRLVCGEWEDAE